MIKHLDPDILVDNIRMHIEILSKKYPELSLCLEKHYHGGSGVGKRADVHHIDIYDRNINSLALNRNHYGQIKWTIIACLMSNKDTHDGFIVQYNHECAPIQATEAQKDQIDKIIEYLNANVIEDFLNLELVDGWLRHVV